MSFGLGDVDILLFALIFEADVFARVEGAKLFERYHAKHAREIFRPKLSRFCDLGADVLDIAMDNFFLHLEELRNFKADFIAVFGLYPIEKQIRQCLVTITFLANQ